ncbi:MAG: hypothetical protein WCH05_08085 [Chlorobiaceae bacterium]
MTVSLKSKNIIAAFVFLLVLLYLFIGTGLHADDYSAVGRWGDVLDFLNPDPKKKSILLYLLPTFYTFWWPYFLIGFQHQWVYDLIKMAAHAISFYCVYRFACDYLPRDRAMLASALFLFSPLHDTTMYWYMTVPYIFFPSVILYAHSLIRHNKNVSGLLLLLLGSFSYYFSPPYLLGMACVFLFERKYRKALLVAVPGVIYILYYLFVKYTFTDVDARINGGLSVAGIIKSLIMQPITLLEAAIGPSYWLKIYYSMGSISLISFIIASGIVLYLLLKSSSFSDPPAASKSLYFGLLSVLLLSFGLYSLTLLYHYSVFNTANRANVYVALLVAFLLTLLPLNRKTVVLFALIFIMPVFGLSDHWKAWDINQKRIIENVKNNRHLSEIEAGSTLLVTGNSYSKLGPFAHIDFFISPFVIKSIFKQSVNTTDILACTSYLYIDHGFLVDPKFDEKYQLTHRIYVYDSVQNSLSEIALSSLPQLLSQRPREIQHWVQLAKGTWIESSIVALSPKLSYLFQ